MTKLKDNCKNRGLLYFLTYADNNAIGYFKKQGFSTFVKMPMDKWKEYYKYLYNYSHIKDYDGGTLMEAYCNPDIEYSNLSEIIKNQKEFIYEEISPLLNIKTKQKFLELDKSVKKFRAEVNRII